MTPAVFSGATPFPWDEAIGLGLGVLRLSPDAFWRMTPRELGACPARAHKGALVPPDRTRVPDRSDDEVSRCLMRARSSLLRTKNSTAPRESADPLSGVVDQLTPRMRELQFGARMDLRAR